MVDIPLIIAPEKHIERPCVNGGEGEVGGGFGMKIDLVNVNCQFDEL